jgi:hypothetical protein
VPSPSVYWAIKRGDLVKVKYHLMDYNGNEEEVMYGIVIDKPFSNQISLFPEVNVYLFKTKIVRTFTAGSIEIISNS